MMEKEKTSHRKRFALSLTLSRKRARGSKLRGLRLPDVKLTRQMKVLPIGMCYIGISKGNFWKESSNFAIFYWSEGDSFPSATQLFVRKVAPGLAAPKPAAAPRQAKLPKIPFKAL